MIKTYSHSIRIKSAYILKFQITLLEKRRKRKDRFYFKDLAEWNNKKKQTTFSLSTQSTCYCCQNLFEPSFFFLYSYRPKVMVSVFTNPLSTERKEPASRPYEFIIIDTRNKLNHVTESHCQKSYYIDTLKAMISFLN